MDKYKLKIAFTEMLLGTVPLDSTIYREIVTEAADLTEEAEAEELATLPAETVKGLTGFHRLPDGTPCLYDYIVKGFFKDSCSALRRVKGTQSAKLAAHKKVIDTLVFATPRQIPLQLSGDVGIMERPLRAQTPLGERVSIARSETIPAGAVIEFELHVLGVVTPELLTEWLTYGAYRGMGQWRNAGYGTFEYEMTPA